jgi:hypothetical protein
MLSAVGVPLARGGLSTALRPWVSRGMGGINAGRTSEGRTVPVVRATGRSRYQLGVEACLSRNAEVRTAGRGSSLGCLVLATQTSRSPIRSALDGRKHNAGRSGPPP